MSDRKPGVADEGKNFLDIRSEEKTARVKFDRATDEDEPATEPKPPLDPQTDSRFEAYFLQRLKELEYKEARRGQRYAPYRRGGGRYDRDSLLPPEIRPVRDRSELGLYASRQERRREQMNRDRTLFRDRPPLF